MSQDDPKDDPKDDAVTQRGPSSRPSVRAPRSRRLERLLESGPRVTARSWVQMGLFILLLVALFVSRDEFGRRAAGCYGQVAPADAPKGTAERPETQSDPGTFAPVVEIRRGPAP